MPTSPTSCRVVRHSREEGLVLDIPSSDITTNSPPSSQQWKSFTLDSLLNFARDALDRYRRIPFLRFRLLFVAILLGCFFVLPGFLSGVVAGVYLSFIAFLFVCVSDSVGAKREREAREHKDRILEEIGWESQKEEHGATKVYRGRG